MHADSTLLVPERIASAHAGTGPDWMLAAQLLIDGCVYLPTAQERVHLLNRVCHSLGPALYPALLGVLCVVGECGSDAARASVADTLVEALCSGRMPTGAYAAWGVSEKPGDSPRAMRSLGPVEYLCAWYAQPGARTALSAPEFDLNMRALLSLLSQTPQARTLYSDRLRALADDPSMDGGLSRATCAGLRQLADAWQSSGRDMHAPVSAFLAALQGRQQAKPAAWMNLSAGWPHG